MNEKVSEIMIEINSLLENITKSETLMTLPTISNHNGYNI